MLSAHCTLCLSDSRVIEDSVPVVPVSNTVRLKKPLDTPYGQSGVGHPQLTSPRQARHCAPSDERLTRLERSAEFFWHWNWPHGPCIDKNLHKMSRDRWLFLSVLHQSEVQPQR